MRIILAVDDDSEDLELLCDVVREVDSTLKCITKSSIADALDYLEQNQLPDLILMDVNIPMTSGLDCLRKLRSDRRFDNVKIVMFSTSTSRQNASEINSLNASFVLKPSSYQELFNTVKGIVSDIQ